MEDFQRQGKVAAFLSVRPRYSFHLVSRDTDDVVTGITDVHGTDLWMNGGFFMFRQEIFDYLRDGEDLVEEPFRRLIKEDQLLAYRYEGFWMPMESLKDLQNLQTLHDGGAAVGALARRRQRTAGWRRPAAARLERASLSPERTKGRMWTRSTRSDPTWAPPRSATATSPPWSRPSTATCGAWPAGGCWSPAAPASSATT